MKSLYLLINIFTILFPLIFSFQKKIAFYKKWKYLFPSLFITAIIFVVWDYLFTAFGVWAFNDNYITGIKLGKLPLEEILFFFTIPYSCIFIYECLIIYISKDYLKPVAIPLSIIIILILGAALYFYYGRLYTSVTYILIIVYMLHLLVVRRPQWLGRFYMGYLVGLIPFFIVNGILTAKPVVVYNDGENSGIRLGTIPIEDSIYFMLLLLMNIAFYERLQKRFVKKEKENKPAETLAAIDPSASFE